MAFAESGGFVGEPKKKTPPDSGCFHQVGFA
jgi:hypothetical protein